MEANRIPIPVLFADQLLGFYTWDACWLFAQQHYQPSYWMILKREGFTGDLLTDSSELRSLLGSMGREELSAIYQLHHQIPATHYWRLGLINDVQDLILSSRIQVYKLDKDIEHRLTNPNDVLYSSRHHQLDNASTPVVRQRQALAHSLGADIVQRWNSKDNVDRFHWDSPWIQREVMETYDVGVQAYDTVSGFLVGLKDIGVLVLDAAGGVLKAHIKFTAKYLETIHNLATGDIEAIRKDLAAAGTWLEESIDTGKKLQQKIEEGYRKLEALLSDADSRDLIYDYLDSLYQSIAYRESRTIIVRVAFEIGLEVLIALATLGAGNVARRTGQLAATANAGIKSSNTAKRLGPFTREAVELMSDLANTLNKPAIKHEPPPVQKLDVPDYAEPKPQQKPNRVTPKTMDRLEVDCFTPGDAVLKSPTFSGNKPKMEKEFYEQIKAQEEGINSLTVGEYLENRANYTNLGRDGVSNGAAQRAAGNKLRRRLTEQFQSELVSSGQATGKEAIELAKQRAAKTMQNLAALHDPDMIAGGHDIITTTGSTGMGNSNINSSIGSQWKTRVGSMDEAAEKALSELGPDAKMNVELSRCKV